MSMMALHSKQLDVGQNYENPSWQARDRLPITQ
jgi:hypothetical protein